ncbi:MAG: S8 family peptidase [Bacteroidales bacterium]|nr:S8 family peptidase [Bacteroidales bacterium]
MISEPCSGNEDGCTPDIDINVEPAWNITTGNGNVKVAVIDDGVEDHEDLKDANNVSRVLDGYTPSCLFGCNGHPLLSGMHGQCCAGIIAASHNNIGIAGVAPNSKIVPIRIMKPKYLFSEKNIAKAINKAWDDLGCDILSNSWDKEVYGDGIINAIENAITYGRNGKGCIIVASSGNWETSIYYRDSNGIIYFPYIQNATIIVGAITKWGYAPYYSRRGDKLSVVAPSSSYLYYNYDPYHSGNIRTIDREGIRGYDNNQNGNYWDCFSGTSVSCSLVSGIASLMLSVNPNLHYNEVVEIIETTSRKIHDINNPNGYYSYTISSDHPHGAWNNEVGYGLVNAHAAVMEAYFNEYTINGNTSVQSCSEPQYSLSNTNVPNGTSFYWETSDNLEIISAQGAPNITVRPIGYGTGWVRVNLIHENDTVKKIKNIMVTSGYSTYYNNYTTTTGPMTINSNVSIAGDFTICDGSTVTISSTAYCSPTARIIIRPGGKLIVNGGTLTNLCPGKMWDGIYVVGNKTQRQLAQYQGTLEVKNNSVIENAKCAIHNWDGSDSNTSGGIVKVTTGSVLRNNGVAAHFKEYTNTDVTGAQTNDESTFSRSSFVIDGYNLLSDNNLTFENFIRMQGTKGISISGCNMRDARTSPDANTKGIYAEGAGFTVTSYCNGAYNSSICACTGTETPTKFSRLGNGVNAVNGGTNYTFKVEKSVFDTCYRAIYVNAVNNYHVTQNDFDMNTYPTFPTNTSSSGLNSNFSSGFKVEANNFYANYATHPSILFDRGIYMSRSGSDVNKIYRNTLSRFYYAIQTSGDNSGLQMLCNEYSNNFVNDEFISGNISSSQGLSTKSAGNKFTLGLSRNISTNTSFTYYHSGYAISTNMFYPATSSSVTKVPNITANDCASTLCNYLPPINPPINPKSSPASDDITLYESLQQEYDSRLAEYDAAGYGFLLENFDEEDADIVALARLKQDTLVSIRRTMAEIANRNIDAILQDTLIFDREALNGWYNRINTQTAKYSLVNSYFEVGEYALARQELASIPQRFALTTDELAEYDNFCQYEALRESVYSSGRNYAQLTEDEIAELQTIVERNTGVSSAYANSVLCFFYGICMDEEIDTDYYFNMDAPLNSKRTTAVTESETEQFAIYVYPNPANEELNILLNSLPEGRTTIEFHDVTGRLVLSEEINSTTTSINISSLKQGVYMYRIINGDNIIARDRIVKE